MRKIVSTARRWKHGFSIVAYKRFSKPSIVIKKVETLFLIDISDEISALGVNRKNSFFRPDFLFSGSSDIFLLKAFLNCEFTTSAS